MNNIELIENTQKRIDEIVELFYQQKEKQAYDALERIITDLARIVDTFYQEDADKEQAKERIDSLTAALKETFSAIEEKDSVLVADVLKYEVYEKLDELKN